MSFEDRLTTACGCAEAIELGAQADARIAALEATLRAVNHTLSDMHDNSPACLFNGAKGEDVGCLACVAQQQIEKGLEGK